MDVCLRVLRESNNSRFDSYSVRNSVLIISHIRDPYYLSGIVACIFLPTTFLKIAVYLCPSSDVCVCVCDGEF